MNVHVGWLDMMRKYARDLTDSRNLACHTVGVPLMAASVPMARTFIGIPLAAGMFATGWALQFAGHAFVANSEVYVEEPSFFDEATAELLS
jgi:uncharacterized membrane protein YGL010W